MGLGQRAEGGEAREMILVRNLILLPGESLETLPKKGAKKLRIPRREIRDVRIIRRSLDVFPFLCKWL